jgi:hypothetical protein
VKGRGAAAASSGALAALLVPALSLVLAPGCRRAKLPPRADGAAVVVVSPTGEAEIPAVSEVEPNDQPAKAHSLVVATQPVAVTASLGSTGGRPDVDLFRLDVVPGDAGAGTALPVEAGTAVPDAGPARPTRIARIELRPDAALAARLDVLDGAGHAVITAAAAEPGQAVTVPNLALAGPAPMIRVRRARADAGVGSYRLLVRTAALEAGAEVEPNGTMALANLLVPDGEGIGFLGWARDQDWYRLPTTALAEGSVLAVEVEVPPEVGATVALVDAKGVKLSETRAGRGERAVLRNVGVPAGATELFLSVTAASGWTADATYAVRVRSELAKAGAETEPNDNPAQAQPITDGTVQGFLARGDVDVFSYTAAAPVALDVELVPPERAGVKLEVLDGTGKSLARAEGRRRAVKLVGVPLAAGAVLVRVAAGKGEGNPDDPYKLTVASRPIEAAVAPAGVGGEAGLE